MSIKPAVAVRRAVIFGTLLAVPLFVREAVVVADRAAAGAPAVSKQAMLDNIGRNVLGPGYVQLASRAKDLAGAADALIAAPDARSLAGAQAAWKDAACGGDLTVRTDLPRISERPRIRLAAAPSASIAPSGLVRLTTPFRSWVPTPSACQLELLLFDVHDDKARVAASPVGRRAPAERAQLWPAIWSRRPPPSRRRGRRAGGHLRRAQQQLDLLVNDLLEAIETGAESRLRVVLERHAEPQFRSELLEGGASGTSQQGLLALLTAAEAVFAGRTGPGIDDYLRLLKSPAAGRMDAQFQKTIDAVQRLGGPLEQAMAAHPDAVKRAHEECRALEIMLKTEVASTLGVTLTFKARDGD